MLLEIATIKSNDPKNVECDCSHKLSNHKLFIDTKDSSKPLSGECKICGCKELSVDFDVS